MIEVLRLHLLLVRLSVVEVVEVGHDDRHRQCDGEHTGDGAQRSHDLPPHADGPAKGNELAPARTSAFSTKRGQINLTCHKGLGYLAALR